MDRAVGLFSGIGGLELGLQRAGFRSELLCEIDGSAQRVLRTRFKDVPVESDVRRLKGLPSVDLVCAGFPCQDLSQAGLTAGIRGQKSRVVFQVFRLLARMRRAPRWLVLENVPFMLQLQQGRAMSSLVSELEALGYAWAYRVVDARSFGLPQRRQRVILVASKTEDPRTVLFRGNLKAPVRARTPRTACGFYWTEGNRGLGWAVDAIPTLKGGSNLGIPSPPAIVLPSAMGVVTPNIRDAERLQGFVADWTKPAQTEIGRKGARWRLVGNAVSVPLAAWLGRQLQNPKGIVPPPDPIRRGDSWPKAAWGAKGERHRVDISMWPVAFEYKPLADFLRDEPTLLSERATVGFLRRLETTALCIPTGLKHELRAHLRRMIALRRISEEAKKSD